MQAKAIVKDFALVCHTIQIEPLGSICIGEISIVAKDSIVNEVNTLSITFYMDSS